MVELESAPLALSLEPEPFDFPAMHYLFVEKRGSIPVSAPQAWGEMHAKVAEIAEHNEVTGYMSLYKMEERIYRAGVSLSAAPQQLPDGVGYEHFGGGKYRKFILRGPFRLLPQATSEAVRRVREAAMRLRDDFNIEHYVKDPRNTPEDQLVTEILFPVE